MNKKLISIIIILILGLAIYWGFLKKEEASFTLADVSRGTIIQEVSETGQVKKGKEIGLGLNTAGRIEKIYVEVGEEVKEEDILAKLENNQLKIQLKDAKAALDLAQAKLDKLLAGSTAQEIQVAETDVANAQVSLTTAKENLNQAFEDSLNVLDDSYLKSYNAFNEASSIQRSYFTANNQEGIRVREAKDKIESALNEAETYLDIAKTTSQNNDIDLALSQMKDSLSDIYDALTIIRETCEQPNYRNIVSSADKTSLDDQRTYINTAQTNIVNSQQTISLKQLGVEAAEGALKAAEDDLSLLIAPPRQEDVDLYEAQVAQAQAQVQLLEEQMKDTILRSPLDGQITKIHKEEGEQVQPMLSDIAISLLPLAPFQIEVDVYEEDIVKIKIGNPVDIFLVVFPDQVFKGKVIAIDPIETLIEGVVYYTVTIDFLEIPNETKPGMTADLLIKTAIKENVLIVSEEALQKKNGKTVVQVLKNGQIQEQEIEIGIRGTNDMVEVLSGLNEGEQIILE